MKMKTLLMLLSCLVLVCSAAFGTIAYLTSTAEVTNTFTVGDVKITVDESDVTEDGKPIDGAPRVTANSYHLMPNVTYTKDPTMTVTAGSDESYVRMIVTIDKMSELKSIFTELKEMYPDEDTFQTFLPQNHVNGWGSDTWIAKPMKEDATNNCFVLEFRYKETVKPEGGNDLVLDALFDSITVPGQLLNRHVEQLNGMQIKVYGHAIQATGFASEDAAWAAFDAQEKVEAQNPPTGENP